MTVGLDEGEDNEGAEGGLGEEEEGGVSGENGE